MMTLAVGQVGWFSNPVPQKTVSRLATNLASCLIANPLKTCFRVKKIQAFPTPLDRKGPFGGSWQYLQEVLATDLFRGQIKLL